MPKKPIEVVTIFMSDVGPIRLNGPRIAIGEKLFNHKKLQIDEVEHFRIFGFTRIWYPCTSDCDACAFETKLNAFAYEFWNRGLIPKSISLERCC